MAFREKSAWIAVITTLAIWSVYFAILWGDYAGGALDGQAVLTRFLVCFGITIAVMLALNLAAARLGRQRFGADLDERERAIESRAHAWGSRTLEWLAIALAATTPFAAGVIGAAYPANAAGGVGIMIANAILLAVLLSQLVHEIAHIVQYRMMA